MLVAATLSEMLMCLFWKACHCGGPCLVLENAWAYERMNEMMGDDGWGNAENDTYAVIISRVSNDGEIVSYPALANACAVESATECVSHDVGFDSYLWWNCVCTLVPCPQLMMYDASDDVFLAYVAAAIPLCVISYQQRPTSCVHFFQQLDSGNLETANGGEPL